MISSFRTLAYQGFKVVNVFKAFQRHQRTHKPDYWHFEKIQSGNGRQVVYSKTVIFATLSTRSGNGRCVMGHVGHGSRHGDL